MATMIEKIGKTVEEALQAALEELKVNAEDVEVEVVESPSKGFFGFGAKPAIIQVKLKENLQPEKLEKISAENVSEVVEEKISAEPEKISEQIEENISAESEKISEKVEKNISGEVEKISDSKEIAEKNFDKSEIIAKAKKFLTEVFAEMKIEAEIKVEETGNIVVFDLVGKNLGILIGKHGQTLDALQYLTNLAANKNDSEDRVHFILDVENYRERREETLKKLAKSVADRAFRMRQDVRLEPMNRHERRIIHTTLQNNDKVETRSAGEEPYRYIIVSPKRRSR